MLVLRQSVQRVGTAHLRVIAAWATQLLLKKCRNGGEPLAAVCQISLAQDLNFGLPLQRLTRYRSTSKRAYFSRFVTGSNKK